MKRDDFASLIFVLASLVVFGVGAWTRASLPITREMGRPLGMGVFLLGMVGFAWATFYLKEIFFGKVAPVSERLVSGGPYRWVRHPLYLSMIITLLGLTLALRSLWGTLAVFGLFVPAIVYRARLEEQALRGKFGSSWEAYAGRTSFLLPMIW